MTPNARIDKIAELFATFRNPDKETVLTPWRVVKLHVDSAFDESFFTDKKKILDINAKTGLYPLYVAQKIYRSKLANLDENFFKPEVSQRFWNETVTENIFVLCKTKMAESITRRTLLGFRGGSVNAHTFDHLINDLKNQPAQVIADIKSLWLKGGDNMFFDAVVGNPPYQIANDNRSYSPPIYHLFMENSFKLADKVSLITPAKFLFSAGTPKEFNQRILNNPHLKVIRYEQDSKKFFPTSDIEGGVAITFYDANETFEPIKLFIPFDELKSIHKKAVLDNSTFKSLSEIIFSKTIYQLTKNFHEDNPDAVKFISSGHGKDFATSLIETFPNLFFDDKPNDERKYVQVHGRQNGERVCKYFRRDWVNTPEPFDKFKVLVPLANGAGAIGEVIPTPVIGNPFISTPLATNTATYITIGAFDSEAEARACLAYIKSKFCRVMLGILKVTPVNPAATWAMVPMQDFNPATSDIDWSGDIDAQLYKKYGLSDAEIKFIEEKVRAMP